MNLYVHFPFCRRKCAYCALHSRAGVPEAGRTAYVSRIAADIGKLPHPDAGSRPTVYFGGGTPALCDLRPAFAAVRSALGKVGEFTVELNPCDVTRALLEQLLDGGVDRISMGVQSLDDGVLAAMGRPHTAAMAEEAFRAIRAAGFENAGFDLIAGWPGTTEKSWGQTLERAVALRPDHVSVYTLIREPGTPLDAAVGEGRIELPGDDEALARHDAARIALAAAGLERYEVSSFARPGRECRHNLSVWRGEDYVGIGEGAHGREGLKRTEGLPDGAYGETDVAPEEDARERAIFALRLAEGIDLCETARRWPVLAGKMPQWKKELESLVPHGIVCRKSGSCFALTPRGFEVCDAVIARL